MFLPERLTRTFRQRTFNSVPFFPQSFLCDFVLVMRCRDLWLLCLDAAFQDSRIVKLLQRRDDRTLRRFRRFNSHYSAGQHWSVCLRLQRTSLASLAPSSTFRLNPTREYRHRVRVWLDLGWPEWGEMDGGGRALRSGSKRKGFRHRAIICDPSMSHNNKSNRPQKKRKWK